MKQTGTETSSGGAVMGVVLAHVVRYVDVEITGLDEAETVDFVRGNERAVRHLQGQSVLGSARLAALGGLSGEDVFSTVGRHSESVARRIQKRGELNEHLPNLVSGFVAGVIPAENLDRVVTTRHRLRHDPVWQSAFDGKERSLVRKASRLNPRAFATYMARLERSLSDDGTTDTRAEKSLNRVKSWTDTDGRFRLSANFDAFTGEQISTALQAEARSLAKVADDAGEPVHHGGLLDAQALAGLIDAGNGMKGRPAVNIIIDHDTLTDGPHPGTVARTQNGLDVPVSVIGQLLCDATVTATHLDRAGRVLAVGRNSRTVTDAQKDALRVMYTSCAVCDVEFSRCEIHHIQYWENGGLTNLVNLVPLCNVHHGRVHHDNWQINLEDDRTLQWVRPDGTIFKTIPLPSGEQARTRAEHRKRESRRL